MSEKKVSWWWKVSAVFAVIGILFLGNEAVRWVWNRKISRDLRQEIRKIAEAGEPLSFQELGESYKSSPEPNGVNPINAAPYYEAALALFVDEETEESDKFDDVKVFATDRMAYQKRNTSLISYLLEMYGKKLEQATDGIISDDILQTTDNLLEKNEQVFQLVDQASPLSCCEYTAKCSIDSHQIPSDFGLSRHLMRLLSVRAKYLISQREEEQAVESIVSEIRLVRIYDFQPILVTLLVRRALEGLVYADVISFLEWCHPDKVSLEKLQKILLETDPSDLFCRAMLGERIWVMQELFMYFDEGTLNELKVHRFFGSILDLRIKDVRIRPLRRRDFVHYLQDMAQIVAAAQKPYPIILDESDAVRLFFDDKDPVFSSISIKKIAELNGRKKVTNLCCQLAVMVERYEREAGRLPDSLEELAGRLGEPIPQDPFSGQPLIYQPGAEEYMIYSVGENRVDDGGQIDEMENQEPKDRGIRVRLHLREKKE
jgi:hypothetical protein